MEIFVVGLIVVMAALYMFQHVIKKKPKHSDVNRAFVCGEGSACCCGNASCDSKAYESGCTTGRGASGP